MVQLATSFQQYSAWRDALASAITQLRRWLDSAQLLEADAARRLEVALGRLAEDKLVIAFVAEFSRGKSELINAIFFADYGRRILPSSAGRTTMCPTELMYDESLPPCIRALPIETRARLGTTSDFKKAAAEWRVFPVDTNSPDGMLQAFKLVSETVRVSVEEARMYGLFDPDDEDQAVAVDRDGMIEISRWRHAVINFPHPLLKQGLVILDTPGLNAIGTEPELTLSLVPSAHAVLFVLAADTGVTKSDLEVWRHIVGADGHVANHLAVLNKIDGLWDPLKSEAEIEAEVEKQVRSVSDTLGLPRARVFPVSAQKGLVAKVTGDEKLLRASRLPTLEAALVDMLVPAKQTIVREQTLAVIDRVCSEVRQALTTRERNLIEQLYELRALQGKNQSAIERLLLRAHNEQRDFEEVVRKMVAARVVLARLANEAYAPLRRDALRERVLQARERMRKARLTPQFLVAVREYFQQLRELLRQANSKIAEIEKMVLGVQRRFAEEQGWSLSPPMPFSLDTYLAELERAEAAYRSHFGPLAVVTRDKWALIERFFDTVVAKSREVFLAAERDTEAWVRSLLPPIEAQVREQRQHLKKRAESVARIREAQESLDSRIGELEEALQHVQQRLQELNRCALQARAIAGADDGGQRTPLPSEPEAGKRLRVQI
ncbi:MAG: dynamin family protein [Sutterellaceae bacterium]|nr:dynamin family protein [Burkholderiaceae bacterium]MCX7901378.1 dynamin family protein [Burkholderiaceae bacterium]MDW8430263.1 dynamin family protein [Sutterellaceae bacterium]